MKNLHYFRKFAVLVMSAMMVLTTFALPTFAVSGESTTLKVEDVDSGATVSAYKVVDKDDNGNWKMVATYGEQKKLKVDNEGNLVKENGNYVVDEKDGKATWVVKDTLIPYDFERPSSDALNALASMAQGQTKTFTFDPPAGTETAFTKSVSKDYLGSYLVLVVPGEGEVGVSYNPMLVSVNPEGDGVKTDDDGNKISANATEVHAKKSTTTFEKVVERQEGKGEATNVQNGSVTGDGLGTNDNASATDGNFDGTTDGNKGDTAGSTGGRVTLDKDGNATFSDNGQTFDDVAFRINTKLPVFADNYFKSPEEGADKGKYPEKVGDFFNPKFIVNDTLSNGLTLKKDTIVVKVGGTEVNKTDTLKKTTDTYTVEYDKEQKDFVITFAPAFLKNKNNKGKAVEICYSASLNKYHGVNFDQATNTAELYYNNAPGEDAQKMDEKETYHYTFTINGKLEGNDIEENREVIKVGIDGEGNRLMQETVCVTEKKDSWKPLQGVEFKLYKANAADDGPDKSKEVKSVITDKDGILRGMNQIDAGVYYLVETSVGPNTEYAKDTTPVRIAITPTLDNKGRMTSYTVEVGKDAENMILVGNYSKDWSAANPAATTVLNTQKTINEGSVKIGETTYTYTDNDSEAADIVNTKVGTLPSTGGMGTVLFTVGGAAIMALALLLLFGGKKKKSQAQK